jgi:SecD/SecF fusion protein
MKNKNTIIALLLIFVAICVYNLYWTYVQFSYEGKLKRADTARTAALAIPDSARTYDDSMAVVYYDDLMKDEEFQTRYNRAINNSFTLGLDLQGGMFVTLEVGVDGVIRQLAGNPTDSVFTKAMKQAILLRQTQQENFVDLFVRSLRQTDPNASLGAIFADPGKGISVSTPDAEIITMLKEEVRSAVDRTFNIIRTRIDQFGVASPNLQKQASTGRILLELPGVKDPDRVRKLLRSTAELEFWTTHRIVDAYPVISDLNNKLREMKGLTEAVDTTEIDSTIGAEPLVSDEADATEVETDSFGNPLAADTNLSPSELLGDSLGADESLLSDDEQAAKFRAENPLIGILLPPQVETITDNSPVVGYALPTDTAQINAYLKMEDLAALIPDDMKFLWTFKPFGNYYALIAIKTNEEDKSALTGDKVSTARQDFDERGNEVVSMRMNAEGSKEWARITEENVGKSVAIVLDKMVYSYPVVQSKITGGSSQISGDFTIEEAKDLANVLKAGQLPVPATIQGEDLVGPTLGGHNITLGVQSFFMAFLVTLLFMALYYAKSGLLANIALVANMLFIMGCSAAFTIVMTLPGIAALVLTIGMAVDANVLIFERIREEVSKGKTLKASIKAGFGNAFSSVMDANVTTFLTGVILYAFGVGPIRGFAVTLMIGIITSLISALIITRLILDYYANRGQESLQFGFSFTTGLFDKVDLKMTQRRKMFYSISGTLVAVSILSFLLVGFKTGVDFKGGRQFVIEFTGQDGWDGLQDRDVEQIRADLTAAFDGDAPVIKTLSSNYQLQITTSYKTDDRSGLVDSLLFQGLRQNYGQYELTRESSTDVGPTVASDIKRAAFYSVLFSLLVIFLYILIRFRKWQYSLGAIIAVFHDVIITLGVFSLLSRLPLPFNLEINQAMIAALLTIIGYSINDTVVVFDRIRENIGEMKASKLRDIYDISINQTISRTLITSMTTLITAIILFTFGGDVIRGFVFAIIVGIVVGTYSSIFVASPIALDLLRFERKRKES